MDERQRKAVILIALGSGILMAVASWFILTRYLTMSASTALAVSVLIGGLDYFLLRFLSLRKTKDPRE